jgi:hypothetical protein
VAEASSFFTERFKFDDDDDSCLGIQRLPGRFLLEWIEPYHRHLRYMLQASTAEPAYQDTAGYAGDRSKEDRELQDILFCLLCSPDEPARWRPVALLAMEVMRR